jgi:flagellar hook-associated protein 2
MGTDLSTLTTQLQALTDAGGVLAAKQGSSSDNNVIALTGASAMATAGSHTVSVTQLAQTSSEYSGEIAAGDTLSGSISIQIGSAKAQTITVDSSSNTLASLAAAINQGSYGVTANVLTDTGGSRLSLVSDTGGAAGQITLTGGLSDTTTSAAIGFTSGQTGQDAQFTVDGISMTSATNTVTSGIPGVTMQLLAKSSPDTPVQLEIANDNASVETAMGSVVTAYNAVVKDIAAQEANSSTGAAQPLYGSPTLSLLQEQLSSALLNGSASGSISNIAQLGLSLGQDGTLTLDSSVLDAALNSNYSDVAGFLQNSGGFGQTFANALNGLGNQAPSGAVYLALQQDSQQETALNESITNENALLATEQTTLTTELNAANQTLQGIPEQIQSINELYSAITGYGANGNT